MFLNLRRHFCSPELSFVTQLINRVLRFSYLYIAQNMQESYKEPNLIYFQSAVPSNWLEFSGVIPLVANSWPRGESTLIVPLMKG